MTIDAARRPAVRGAQRPFGRSNGTVPQSISTPRTDRLAAALPPWRLVVVGAPLWGCAMAFSAAIALALRVGVTQRLGFLMLLYCAGGILAWPFALGIARFFAAGRPRETRFAAYLVALVIATIAATAFLFAMNYRLFYAQWHEPIGTRIWAYQFAFTSAAAAYQFVAIGIRLYLPVAAVAVLLTSVWLSGCDPAT